eukprot:358102-Pelagomonas_calceolata.AAC.2
MSEPQAPVSSIKSELVRLPEPVSKVTSRGAKSEGAVLDAFIMSCRFKTCAAEQGAKDPSQNPLPGVAGLKPAQRSDK